VKLNIKKISLRRANFYLAGIGIAAFLGVLIVLTLNFYVARETIPIPEIPENTSGADMQFNKIHYTSTDEQGIKEWELNAVTANYFREKKLAEFEEVDIIFYSKKGGIFTMRGDIGLLNTETRDIQLSGNVIGTSNDGYRFRTESLTYKADKRQAKTDDKVFLEGPQFNLEGWGMIMDLENEKVMLQNDVRAQGKNENNAESLSN